MQILVAGGAGFIGSHLCQSLLKDGYRVICIDNFLTGKKANVAPLLAHPKFLLINTDVSKPLPEALIEEKLDYIFHLASPASPNSLSPLSYMNLPLETMDANSLGTRRLLRLARKHKAKFLFASTSEVYGDPQVHPQPETYWGYVNPVGIRSCYDEAKRFGEALTMVYIRRFKLNARIVRIFNTYGPRMDIKDGRAVANFIVQALTNQPITIYGQGKQTRSFCYVDDLVTGLKKALLTESSKGQVINLGNPEEFTVLDLAKKIKRATGSASPIKIEAMELPEDDPEKRRPDISRAKKLLGWQPKIKFSRGLEKTIAYFREKLANEPK
ncbi:NAD-dependent dehydratase [Candidatus Beckwithbacteria bacterium CG22_combo_CG10-13_8_21_14_all_01_47_9]|uniref:UDP-glucuronate decarboxylase n=4 Tax=Candidatus Beckwithiibacteriota TaxID=1752726 RepID=A0A2H0DZZ8_9BACT|nr:MAG: NAD-dependent dehydratase [Candidatus Beckwithbacteria bacterium CG1_02_47_37]PIP87764.1 MAG: NAD-dependent dehydratase [Candidatus Beckwithbacteria bacterium CG22_combo_CG10-13_8_21_14_all_01_47_9]PJA22559.1 MAG: NAD-dependent dehydratase [Candidatus Beckwithbacteria bacterium CG_4_10_14_0_2_um_filter_47_25]PJC66257.1 MAG: NAD-dependent dehydratase [Candidatus Beckwithbacteria bacterium CG_4_9_14_0_2_um_filter_47_11]